MVAWGHVLVTVAYASPAVPVAATLARPKGAKGDLYPSTKRAITGSGSSGQGGVNDEMLEAGED